jgi:glycerophosphoryl diester phosphodiesterase
MLISAIEKSTGTKIEIYPDLKGPSYQKKHELYFIGQTIFLLTDSATLTKRS